VALAAILAGGRVTGSALRDQRIVILGAGAAGLGIARLLRSALAADGLAGEALHRALASVESHGLLVEDDGLHDEHQHAFAWPRALADASGLGSERHLEAVVRAVKPTVLIGISGQPGTFTEPVIRAMAAQVPRPLVLPLSNPTSQCEATPADLLGWTRGRALVATGSPFPPVAFEGRVHHIGQGNNAFVFPGLGLGALLCEAREITDGMFAAAARRLAEEVRDRDLEAGLLFPPVAELRRVTAGIAEAVIREARREGVGQEIADGAIARVVAEAMWFPDYVPYRPV
jgi:malate dehydrogenase (oxaloacetate-decarboxylating)